MSKLIRFLGLVFLGVLSINAQADIYGLMRKVTMDRLEFEIQVADEAGKPLVGAVIWYIDNPVDRSTGQKITAYDANRMAQRYARQSDFLNPGDIPGSVLKRTNMEGVCRNYRETRYPDGKYPYVLVATKRGYLPEVAEGVAPLNQHYLVKFNLKPDPQWTPDPRMETFDQLMAQAISPVPGEDPMGEKRMLKLESINQQLQALAQSLERDGKKDEASAIYWALADLPSVKRIDLPNGTQQIVGYRKGVSDEQAEADRLRATLLNTTVPKLTIRKALVNQGFKRTGIYDAANGKAYLNEFERIAASSSGDQLLPIEYDIAARQARKWGPPDYDCEFLQRAFDFEPTAISPRDGWEMLKEIADKRKELNLPPKPCVIEGLAPFTSPWARK